MSSFNTLLIVLKVLLFLSVTALSFSTMSYLKKYNIPKLIYAKFRGKTLDFDRIHRQNVKMDASTINVEGSKLKILDKVYKYISDSGIGDVIPGFSESAFLVITGSIAIQLDYYISFVFISCIF